MNTFKKFIFLILLSGLGGFQLFGQNIFWVESAFDAPRLVKTGSDSSELFTKTLPAGSQPQSIVLDQDAGMVYWNGLSFINAELNRIPMDLSTHTVLKDSLSALRGLALDSQNNHLYWTATNLISGPSIGRFDYDTQTLETLIDFGSGSGDTPREIDLDMAAQKMYWSNFGAGKIQRADMSAGAIPEDVITGLNGPTGLAVDADSGKIFWTETNGHQIKSANLDGSNIQMLVDGLSSPNYISVDRYQNRMAWTELGSGKIKSADLDGSNILDYGITAHAPAGIAIEAIPDTTIPPDTTIIPDGKLTITPKDTTIQVHNGVQFSAWMVDSNDVAHATDADWFLFLRRLGPINKDGYAFAYFPGKANIFAYEDRQFARTRLNVVDTSKDEGGKNKIKFIRDFRSWKDKKAKTICEGETFKLTGLPFPYNLLNGTSIYFPKGSLHEDISIKIQLPRFSKLLGDSVSFPERIFNGIKFDVFVKDSLVEPYHFDKPVSVAFPIRKWIMRLLGIEINNIGLFYADDSLTFESAGISHVMLDRSERRIYGLVEHFSTLVVGEIPETPTVVSGDNKIIPEEFVLEQNFPNPFNPVTTIRYALPKTAKVDLSVYNLLGQKVATLVSDYQSQGNYQVQWDAREFTSGVYLYRLQTNTGFMKTRKLILIK